MKRNFKKTEAVQFKEHIQNNKFRHCSLHHHKIQSIELNCSILFFFVLCTFIQPNEYIKLTAIQSLPYNINETIAKLKKKKTKTHTSLESQMD